MVPAAGEPAPEEPAEPDNGGQLFKGDFFQKLFAWLIELFQMFTRWIEK